MTKKKAKKICFQADVLEWAPHESLPWIESLLDIYSVKSEETRLFVHVLEHMHTDYEHFHDLAAFEARREFLYNALEAFVENLPED